MKKSFTFLAVLLSINYLLAQTSIKAQSEGYRVQDRLKAEGYRLEVEKTGKVLSENTTTNYQLRTTSCDSSVRGLNDHLMMFPEGEEGEEFLEKELIGSEKKSLFQIESSVSNNSSKLNASASVSNQKAIETTAIGIVSGTAEENEVAQSLEQGIDNKINSPGLTTSIPQTVIKGQPTWIKRPVAVIFLAGCYAIAQYMPKCLGMPHEVTNTSLDNSDPIWLNQDSTANSAWGDVHEKDQAAQVVWNQAISHQPIESYINTINISKAAENSWNKAINEAQRKKDFWSERVSWAEAIEAAETALEKAQTTEIMRYGGADEFCINEDNIFNKFKVANQTIDKLIESFKVNHLIQDENINTWINKKNAWANKYKDFLPSSKEILINSIDQSEETVKFSIALKKEQAEAKSEEIVEKIRIVIEKLEEARSEAEKATVNNLSSLKETVAYLEKSSEYWEKAFEAQKIGAKEAVDYSLIAAEFEQVAEYSRKAANAYAQAIGEDKNFRIGNRWKKAGESMQFSVDCEIKAIEAQGIGREDRTQQYIELSRVFKQALEDIVQAARLLEEGKEKENYLSYYQGRFLQSEAISKKYRLQEEEAQEAEKTALVEGYRGAAEISQKAADAKKLSVERYTAGQEGEAHNWAYQGESLQLKAHYQAKALEAEEVEERPLATGYLEAVEFSQKSVDALQLSMKRNAKGKTDEAMSWELQGGAFRAMANYKVKALEAQKAGDKELAAGYQKIVEICQRATDALELSAKRNAKGKIDEAVSWSQQGQYLHLMAVSQEKVMKAQEVGDEALVSGYQKVVETSQRSVDALQLFVKRKAAGKEDEATSWMAQGISLHSMASFQAKAVEAQEAGIIALTAGYQEAAEISQRAADASQLSVERYVEGKKDEATSWIIQGMSFQLIANSKVKALEAQEAGDAVLAADYQKVVETSQRAVDALQLSAERVAEGKEDEAMSWRKQGQTLHLTASFQAQALKAQEAGDTILAANYAEQARISQKTADAQKLVSKKEVLKKALKKEDGSMNWEGAVEFIQAATDYQTKSLVAQELGQKAVAAGYQEAAQTSQRAIDQLQLAVKRRVEGKNKEADYWGAQGLSLQAKASYQRDMIEAENSGKKELAAVYREAVEISQKAADASQLAAERKAAGKEDEGISWARRALSLQEKADYQVDMIESEEAGKKELASAYQEASELSQQAVDAWKRSAESYAAGKEKEGRIWDDQGHSLHKKATYQVKAIELQDAGNEESALVYREASELFQQAADAFQLAIEREIAGKLAEGNSWDHLGASLRSKADYQVKAIELQGAGNEESVIGYREVAELSQQAVDAWKLTAERYASGKEGEGISYSNQAESLQKKADYKAKAVQEEEVGKRSLAIGYGEAAESFQKVADVWKLSAEKKAVGKNDEGINWGWQGASLQAKADYQVKAIEAREVGNIALEAAYREVVETYQGMANQWKFIAQTFAKEKEKEAINWRKVSASLQAKFDYQNKTIKAQEVGKKELAASYQEIVEIFQRAADQWKLAAEKYAAGKESEGISYSQQATCLQTQAVYQDKSLVAEESGKKELAKEFWEDSESFQKAADAWRLSIEKKAAGKNDEGISYYRQAVSLQKKAYYQAKLIQEKEAGKSRLAAGYQEAVESFQKAADIWKLSAEKKAAGKNDEGTSWGWQGSFLEAKADHQVKAIEAWEVGNIALEAAYREVAETYQSMADQWKFIAQIFTEGKENEAMNWQKVNALLQSKADYQTQAIDAQEAGRKELAASYREIAESFQKAADQWKLTVERHAAGKKSEGISYDNQVASLQKKADYQIKVVVAEEAGKKELAAGYQEAVKTSQKAADQWKLSAEEKAAGKNYEGTSWGWQGSFLQTQANYEVKAIEAQEAGRKELAASYRAVAETYQKAADASKLAAESDAAGKQSEGDSWSSQWRSLQLKADYQIKAIKAQEKGKTVLETGYLEAAEISQKAADVWKLAATSKALGKIVGRNNWDKQGASLQSKANYQVKAIEATKVGKTALAAGYQEAAETSQKAADQWKLAAHHFAGGKKNEAISRQEAGISFQVKANYQAKAIEAQEIGKKSLAVGYREAAETSQKAADQWKLAAQNFIEGKQNEAISRQKMGESLQAKTEYQVKVIEAQEAGMVDFAAGYQEAVETSQKAVNEWKLAAQNFARGKETKAISGQKVAASFQAKANYQAKAIEAQEAGKRELAAGYQEAAVIYQRAADQYKESAQACAVGNSSEDTRLFNQAEATQAEANAIAKKAEQNS